MDIAVYGLMRSGTTLVSDMLTVRGKSLVISEPDFFVPWDERTVQRIYKLTQEFGLHVPDRKPEPEQYGTFSAYFDKELLPQLDLLDKWGVKQVNHFGWRQLFERYSPQTLLLCLRDLRDAHLSSFDLISRMKLSFGDPPVLKDEAWLLSRFSYDIHELLSMRPLSGLTIRYEDLVRDPSLLGSLVSAIGFDEIGQDRWNLRGEPEARKGWELDKHKNGISTASLGRFENEPPGPARSLSRRVWSLFPGYSKEFGYELPPDEYLVDQHSLVNSAGKENPVTDAVLGWGRTRLSEVEPAFARRAARIVVAQGIKPGSTVLELGCVVPALQYLLPAGCRYIGSDVAKRYEGCLVADYNRGEMPPKSGATLVVVLGLLEYITKLREFLEGLRAYAVPVVLSYHASEDTVEVDRDSLGWVNNLSRADVLTALGAAGFRVQPSWAFDGNQSLFVLDPA